MSKKMLSGALSLGLLSLMFIGSVPNAQADRYWGHDRGNHFGWRNHNRDWRWDRFDRRDRWRNNWSNNWNWNLNNGYGRYYNPYNGRLYTRYNTW